MLKNIFLVGIGSFVGGSLRFIVSYLTRSASTSFPVSTLIVNILGCFLIGILSAIGMKYSNFPQELSLLLITGLCGGFTTFSTFSYEGLSMLQAHNYLGFITYIIASIILGLLAVFAGMKLI